jgi:hypothetical protein
MSPERIATAFQSNNFRFRLSRLQFQSLDVFLVLTEHTVMIESPLTSE